jgi:hypothetical protein
VAPPSTGLTSAVGEFNVPDLNGVELLSLIVVTTGIKKVLPVAPDFSRFLLSYYEGELPVTLLEYFPTIIFSYSYTFERYSDEK